MRLHPDPFYQPIPVKAVIPSALGTKSQGINPWIGSDRPAATICKQEMEYRLKELKEAEIKPGQQKYRVLTGQEPPKHFGLVRVDPEKPSPTVTKSIGGSTTGLVHPYEVRHLTISEVKALSSFPAGFVLEGKFADKWARIGNSVPPLFMREIAGHVKEAILGRIRDLESPSKGLPRSYDGE